MYLAMRADGPPAGGSPVPAAGWPGWPGGSTPGASSTPGATAEAGAGRVRSGKSKPAPGRAPGPPGSPGSAYTREPSAARSRTTPSSSRSLDRVACATCMPAYRSSSPASCSCECTCSMARIEAIRACLAAFVAGADGPVMSVVQPSGSLQQPGQQRLLRVQPVLRLIPDDTGRAVDHLGGDLLAAMRGQAVQHDRAGRAEGQQLGAELEGSERGLAGLRVAGAHRNP